MERQGGEAVCSRLGLDCSGEARVRIAWRWHGDYEWVETYLKLSYAMYMPQPCWVRRTCY